MVKFRLPKEMPGTFIEFFAGIGLMRLGLERAGWQVEFANDIDPLKLQMYRTQWPQTGRDFVLGDIHKLVESEIPTVDLATASFPCTDLSLAGGRKGLDGAQSSAFWGLVRLLRELGPRRPRLVLLENVPGFLTSNKGSDFRAAMQSLNELGYAVDPFVLDAACFVPQSRQRLFVVGVQAGGDLREAPASLTMVSENPQLRPKSITDFMKAHSEITWITRPLPEPPPRRLRLDDIIEDLAETAPEWWSEERVCYLLNQMSERHRTLVNDLTARQKITYSTVFRRVRSGKSMAEVRSDGVAGCLRTPKGGSARQILLKCGFHTVKARLLTARECARLMGAPDYRLEVPLNQALFGFGDAVCVDAVTWIAQNYLEPALLETGNFSEQIPALV